VVEEVLTQGESIAVPIKRVEGSKSAFPDSGISGCVGASFRWKRILSVIVFIFSEIIPHRAKILSCRYSVISMVASTLASNLSCFFSFVI